VLMVENDPAAVERDLLGGALRCPSCGEGVLGPWWYARKRILRDGQALRPRRARCRAPSCRVTHVLLFDVCLLRRRDSVEVIGAALAAGVTRGEHHEAIGVRLAVPGQTVCGWLRRLRRLAEAICSHFTRWLVAIAPGEPLPKASGLASRDALEAIGAACRAASLRLADRLPWSWASRLSAGRLLVCNSSSIWPSPE